MRKIMVVVICAILMASAIGIIFPTNANPSESQVNSPLYTTHDPIYINGNENFTADNGVTGGSGAQSDPYIIKGWDISAFSANGIEIRNTDAYFIIRNCYVHDGWDRRNEGIYFYNVTNGMIENTISTNNCNGIYLEYSSYATLVNNTLENDGIFIWGLGIEYFNTHNIDTTNTANSKPIYYYANQKDINIDGWSAGQVILANCTDFVIKNIDCSNAYVGVQLAYCDGCSIETSIFNNEKYGIHLSHSSNIIISNNTANSNYWDGIHLYESSSNTVSNNTANSNHKRGINLHSSSNNNNIFNNSASNNANGIHLYYSMDDNIFNNSVSNNNYGISLYDHSRNNNIFNNSANSNNQYGIYLSYHTNNNNIYNNSANSNNYCGIYLDYSNNNDLSNNSVLNNIHGIYLYYISRNNNISNNSVNSNSHNGIHLWYSDHNFLFNNTINSNGNTSIYIEHSSENSILSNNVSNNYYGISLLYSSNNNSIWHNNLMNNTIQAYDMCANYWDDGYPSGGNYWSDYAGVDEKIGPNQDQPGSDGIGDIPYDIPGGDNQDHYPLMTPCGAPPIAPPTNLTANATGNSGEIELDWDDNTEAYLNHYSVYRRNDGDWNWIDNTTVSYYLNTGLTDGVTYRYYVTASDNVPNESDPSNEANATPYSVPIADAGPDQESFNGIIVNFDGSNSYDPDGTIVNWTWDFGDGTIGHGMTTTHVYFYYGVYNVILTVKDNDGRTGTDTAIVNIWQNGHDLSILKVQSPHNVRMGSTKTVVVWVENLGIYDDYGLLSLIITAPDGTKTTLTTIVKEKDGTSLDIGNKVRITFSVTFNQRGTWTFYAHVDISDSNGNINPFPFKDYNPTNNDGEPPYGTDCK